MELLHQIGEMGQIFSVTLITAVTNIITYFLTLKVTAKKAKNDLQRDDAETIQAKMLSKRTLVDTIDFLEIRIAEMSAKVEEARSALFTAKSDCEQAISRLLSENSKLKSQLITIKLELEQYRTGKSEKS